MNGDIEIVVFNDKSWVRFSEYEKLEEEDNELIHFLQEQRLKLEEENEQLKAQIEKMKCCANCKYCDNDNPCFFHKEHRQCVDYLSWELPE